MSNRSEVRNGNDFDPQAFLNAEDTQSPPEPNEDTGDETVEETTQEVDEISPDVEQPTTEVTEPSQEGDTEMEETSDDVEALKKELDNYKNRYSNAEKLIGKHSQELSQLRKFQQQQLQNQQQSQTEEPNGDFLDDFVKNPQEALSKELQKRDNAIQQQRQKQEQWVNQNMQHVYNTVPNFDELKGAILGVGKEDGIAEPSLQMLQQTVQTDPLLAIQFAKRASLKKEMENIRNNGKETIKQIAKNSKKTPTIKGKQSASSSKEITDSQLRSMSRDEIQKRLTEMGFYGK